MRFHMLLKPKLYLVVAFLIIFALLAGACAERDTVPGLENTTWILEHYGESGNLQVVLAGSEITVIFDSDQGQVRGSAGCNQYFGDYHISNDRLSILEIAYTEMACLEPEGVMEQEQRYLTVFQAAESYQIQDERLQIDCGEQVLIFVAEQE